MAVALPRSLFPKLAGLVIFILDALLCQPAPAGDQAADPASVRHGPEPVPSASARTTPIQVYRALCLECHDSDGKGEVGRDVSSKIPDFTNPGWHASRSDAELSRSILEGKGKSMPRMKNKLGSVDVKQMVAFVRAFQGGKQIVDDTPEAPGTPEQAAAASNNTVLPPRPVESTPSAHQGASNREGSRLFQRFCARCHSPDGTGTNMRDSRPTIPDFTQRAWQVSRNDPQLLVSVIDGKGVGMPPFRDKVAREQVRDLVAFIRAFGPSQSHPAGAPSDDFEDRFKRLLEEFENIRRQIRALSAAPAPSRSNPL
jgi:mono/diheme cytochrome c family protein